jgi:hypothetical protein
MRRGDINASVCNGFPLIRMSDERSCAGEQLRESATVLSSHVDHDEDRRGEVCREPIDQLFEGFYPAGRGPNHEDVMSRMPSRCAAGVLAEPTCSEQLCTSIVNWTKYPF